MKHPFTWPLLILAFLLSLLPRPVFLFFGRGLGSLLRVLRFRRDVVEQNLAIAFPEWTAEEREKFIRKNYAHTGIVFLEILRAFYGFTRFLDKYCLVEGGENVQRARAHGKGVIILSAHMGNWEVLVGAGAYQLPCPVTMVTKRLKPEWLQNLAEATRARFGVKMAFEPKTMPTILAELKNNGLVGIVLDQYTGAPVGARVPFFGVAVGSHTVLAKLALRTGAVVVPAISYRRADGKYVSRFEPEVPLIQNENLDEAILINTARFVAYTEKWIREFPEQWLWIHRRFKGDLSPLAPNRVGEMLK
jgi:KDO2-lipid IV(A) lauroyltransferase